MADPAALGKLVPGFDFLQSLVANAGAAIPGIGQWVAPTLDPAELDKRIEELRTVQFWLEQNARMLGATIQALEVQRMTLSTLRTMNVQMEDLRESLKIRLPVTPRAAAKPPAAPAGAPRPAEPAAAEPPAPEAPGGVVDPMQWWGALTRQFTELAAGALKDGAAEGAKHLAATLAPAPANAPPTTPAQAPAEAAASPAGGAAPKPARKRAPRPPA